MTATPFASLEFTDPKRFEISSSFLYDTIYIDWESNFGVNDYTVQGLYEKYSELHREGEFLRGAISYEDEVTGQVKGFVYEVDDFTWKNNDSNFGNYTIKGRLLDRIYDEGEESLDEIVGDSFQALHNEFISSNYYTTLPKGIKRAGLFFDTTTVPEFQELNPGESFLKSYTDVNPAPKLAANSAALILGNGADTPSTYYTYNSEWEPSGFHWSKTGKKGSAEAYVTFDLQPKLKALIDMPDSSYHWYEFLIPGYNYYVAYKSVKELFGDQALKVDVDLLLDWTATAGFKTGADDNGMIELINYDLDILGKDFFLGYFNGTLGADANLAASVGANGLASDYKFKATQQLGIEIANTNERNDYQLRNLSKPVVFQKPTFNQISDIKFDASITPGVDLKIGYVIPKAAPFFSNKSVLSLNGKLTVPVELSAYYDGRLDGDLTVSGFIEASATAMEFIDGGWTYPIAKTGFFEAKKEHIFG